MPSTKPLKILTIDGGGLQALSTLLILDRLLDAIAKTNNVPHRKPRPCDVFDTIAGIGAGGWLAILLGRFHMDITTCLSEWYKITQHIAPRSITEEIRLRAMKHCYFNHSRLVQQIDALTKTYGTGDFLFDNRAGDVRTRHVFVAALRSDAEEYNLFRSYELPTDAVLPEKLLEGPEDAAHFKISNAFGVTGAAKYFSPLWNERMSQSGKSRFKDSKFPNPHNITELALNEMWAIYGLKVEMSIIVNIGPGLPSEHDVHQISRRFSWGQTSSPNTSFFSKRSRSLSEEQLPTRKRTKTDPEEEIVTEGPSVHFFPITKQKPPITPAKRPQLPQRNTVGSIQGRTVGEKLKRKEVDIENDIKGKLSEIYKDKRVELYYRLAPPQAPQGTARNDSVASGVTRDATKDFLGLPHTVNMIEEIAKRIPS